MRPLKIPSSIEASSFHELFTGTNPRLEIIGLIITIAARSISFGLALDRWNSNDRQAIKPQSTDEMLRASTTYLELCMRLAMVNDILLWLLCDNLLLSGIICGDTSQSIQLCYGYKILILVQALLSGGEGRLSTEIYALGIHRKPRDVDILIFLLESRRRIICASYNIDRRISTFLGRPPRIC